LWKFEAEKLTDSPGSLDTIARFFRTLC